MPLSFSNAIGNWFNRAGKLGLTISQVRSYQTSQLANYTNVTTGIVAQFNGESDIQALMGSAYIGLLNSGGGGNGSLMRAIAAATLSRMIFRDNPQLFQTLQNANTLTSLKELIRQMKVAGASVRAHTLATTTTTFTGTGNGVIVVSTRRPSDGLILENAFAETMKFTCTADSYQGGATKGNETLALTGTGKQIDHFSFDWPLGSDASTSINAIDGNADVSSGNLLTNGGFETFTGNTPANYSIITGVAGVDFFKETGIVYDPPPNFSLRLTGVAGATLTQFRQEFNATAGTSGTLDPLTQYGLNIFLRRDGVAAAAGTLVIDLVDENGTAINDINGTANSLTIDLTALTTTFTAYNTDFRTPLILPSRQFLRFRLTVALTNGRSVYMDKVSLGEMTQSYTGGPWFSVHAGSTPFVEDDYATCAITNTRASGGGLDTFQTLMFRLFPDIETNELILPSSATPTIADAMIG